ncbi:hypothetical protein MAUC95_23590 [Mycobacteroides abscessus]|nr:hypothetical protein MAUC95_23590 [Mycobacteroides abscessus]
MSLVSPNLAFVTEDKQLSRIAALLRQAEGTDNTHEAEAFMAAAQRLPPPPPAAGTRCAAACGGSAGAGSRADHPAAGGAPDR